MHLTPYGPPLSEEEGPALSRAAGAWSLTLPDALLAAVLQAAAMEIARRRSDAEAAAQLRRLADGLDPRWPARGLPER